MPQGRGKITWRAQHCVAGPWARGEESTRGRGSGWSVPASQHRAPEATKNPGYFADLSQEALEGPPFPRDLLKTKFTPQDSPRGNFHFGKIWVFFLSCLSPSPVSPFLLPSSKSFPSAPSPSFSLHVTESTRSEEGEEGEAHSSKNPLYYL